ncbi:MAG: hypothetical protein QXS07_00850 [Candidatus Pacearchaeota archaeon]
MTTSHKTKTHKTLYKIVYREDISMGVESEGYYEVLRDGNLHGKKYSKRAIIDRIITLAKNNEIIIFDSSIPEYAINYLVGIARYYGNPEIKYADDD